MQFSDTSTNQGLVQDCEFFVFGGDYGQITDNTENLQEFTRLINEGLNKTSIKIMTSDTRWQFDDPNHTDLPIATATLNSGQQQYQTEFNTNDSHLEIERVEIKTSGGLWKKLVPIDLADSQEAQAELYKTDGEPAYYDKMGNTLMLYPAPNYTQAASLKIFYQREPSYFATTDTTKKPGIPTMFHRLVTLHACEDFTASRSMTEKNAFIRNMRVEAEEELQNFYNRRDKEDKPKLATKRYNFK